MNDSHDRILTKYSDADFNQRLHMYLQLRDRRSEFMAILQNELTTGFSGIEKSPSKGPKFLDRIIGRKVCFYLKKAFVWT